MEEEEIIIKGFTDCVYFLASPLTCKKVLYINHLFVRVLYNLSLQCDLCNVAVIVVMDVNAIMCVFRI